MKKSLIQPLSVILKFYPKYPQVLSRITRFFFGCLFIQADGFNYAEFQGQIWLFPCVDPQVLILKSDETFLNQPPNMSCIFSTRFEKQQQQQQNKQALNKTCKIKTWVFVTIWRCFISFVRPQNIGSTLQIAHFFITLPQTTLNKIAPNAPNNKLQLPTVDFQGWILCLGSGSVMVNWRFGVWWFGWLILGTWKTSPPRLCCILRLLWHGLTEPENGVREPTYYATMRFRDDWTPQSFSDNMTGYSPYQQVSRISSVNSINQLRFKTLRFLLLFLPTLVQIDVFSFSFTLMRFRLRSEIRNSPQNPRRRTHVSSRRPSYGVKNQPTNLGMK